MGNQRSCVRLCTISTYIPNKLENDVIVSETLQRSQANSFVSYQCPDIGHPLHFSNHNLYRTNNGLLKHFEKKGHILCCGNEFPPRWQTWPKIDPGDQMLTSHIRQPSFVPRPAPESMNVHLENRVYRLRPRRIDQALHSHTRTFPIGQRNHSTVSMRQRGKVLIGKTAGEISSGAMVDADVL